MGRSMCFPQVRFRVGIINKQQGKHDEALLVSQPPAGAAVRNITPSWLSLSSSAMQLDSADVYFREDGTELLTIERRGQPHAYPKHAHRKHKPILLPLFLLLASIRPSTDPFRFFTMSSSQ